jgi:hypothetical protein
VIKQIGEGLISKIYKIKKIESKKYYAAKIFLKLED